MEIYKMKLHDRLSVNIGDAIYNIIRVPGGWLYNPKYIGKYIPTFVPFDNEFMAGGRNFKETASSCTINSVMASALEDLDTRKNIYENGMTYAHDEVQKAEWQAQYETMQEAIDIVKSHLP